MFVSPGGDGSGLVIDPAAPLPRKILDEIDAVTVSPTSDAVDAELSARRTALRNALDAADASVLVVYATPTFDRTGAVTGVQYSVSGSQEGSLEFATSHRLRPGPNHDLAVAAWGPFLADNLQYTLVDTTTLG